jgi:hypothetical protein
MCCTLEPARLSSTYLLAHTLPDGRNVIGYQNRATNQSRTPNAMILPFPSSRPMTRENCIDMSGCPKLFHDYGELLKPRSRGGDMMKGSRLLLERAEVFDSGSYTVVLAADARAIPEALSQVPESKRPRLHPEMFEAFNVYYPGWSVALCCWNGEIEAEPMLWWYEPIAEFRDKHFLPGLDGHDGRIPDPARNVAVDHTLIVGAPSNTARNNASALLERVSPEIRSFLPEHVWGGELKQMMLNGDWALPKQGWTYDNMVERLRKPREKPPGFQRA